MKKVVMKPSALQMHGCCGLSLPVTALLFSWEEEQKKPLRMQIEKKENAWKAWECVKRGNGNIVFEKFSMEKPGIPM